MVDQHRSFSASAGNMTVAERARVDVGHGRDYGCFDDIGGLSAGQTLQDKLASLAVSQLNPLPSWTTDQLDAVMEKFSMEFRAKLFDEIVEKVKNELNEASHGDSGSDTVCGVSPMSQPETRTDSVPTPASKPYQATVEDDHEAEAEGTGNSSSDGGDATPDSPFATSPVLPLVHSPLQTPPSSVRSESISSTTSISSACQQDVAPSGAARLSAMRSYSSDEQKTKPRVRWSDRCPAAPEAVRQEGDSATVSNRVYFPPQPGPDAGRLVVDPRWGQLFDNNSEPTERLKQVLRGLADYLIAEFSPRDSLVITPEKLYLFYNTFMLDTEVFGFHHVFDCSSRDSYKDLECLYQDMRCEYHLVPSRSKAKPHIPSLTSRGFTDWMTLLIRAYPDQEARRMERVAERLPLEAEALVPGRRWEWLPKHFSRQLFPAQRHERIYSFMANTFAEWKRMTGDKKPTPSSRSAPNQETAKHCLSSVTPSEAQSQKYGPQDRSAESKGSKPERGSIVRASSYTSGVQHSDRSQPRSYTDKYGRHGRNLSPPPIGVHYHRRKHDSHKRMSSTEPRFCARDGNYDKRKHYIDWYQTPGSGSSSGDRRTREDEYRCMQGRDARGNHESTPGSSRRG